MLGMEITFASFVAFGEGLAKKEISSLLFSKEWFFPPREIGFEIMLGGIWWHGGVFSLMPLSYPCFV